MNCDEAGEVLVNLINISIEIKFENKAYIEPNHIKIKTQTDYKNLLISFFKEHSIKEGLSLLPVQEAPKQDNIVLESKDKIKLQLEIIETFEKMQKAKKAMEECLINNPKIEWGFYPENIEGLSNILFSHAETQELKQHEKDVKALIESTSIVGGTEATEYLKQQIENMLHAPQ